MLIRRIYLKISESSCNRKSKIPLEFLDASPASPSLKSCYARVNECSDQSSLAIIINENLIREFFSDT